MFLDWFAVSNRKRVEISVAYGELCGSSFIEGIEGLMTKFNGEDVLLPPVPDNQES